MKPVTLEWIDKAELKRRHEAVLLDRNLPVDEIEVGNLADEILRDPPPQGFLTISNALQWRLQYGRVLEKAGIEEGIRSVYRSSS
jgi:hypothetical protein